MANVVEIIIRASDRTHDAFEAAQRGIRRLADRFAESDGRIRNTAGRLLESIRNRISGSESGFSESFSGLFQNSLRGALSLSATGPVVIGAVAAIAAILAPAIATLIGGAIILGLGAGLVGIGAMLLMQNEEISSEFTKTFSEIKEIMTDAFMPLLPVLRFAIGMIKDLAETFAPFIKRAMELAKVPLTNFIKNLGTAFEQLAPAIGPIMDAFGKILDELGPKLPGLFADMADALIHLAEVVGENADEFATMVGWALALVPPIIDLLAYIADLSDIYGKAKDVFSEEISSGFFDKLSSQVDGIVSQVTEKLWPAFQDLLHALEPVGEYLSGVLGPLVQTTFEHILEVVSGAIDIITGIIKVFTAVLTGDWGAAWDGIVDILRGAWKIVAAVVKQGVALAGAAIAILVTVFRTAVTRAVNSAVSAARAIGRGIAGAIRAGLGLIGSALGAVRSRVTGFFASAGSWLVGAGRRVISGLISGIRSAAGSIMGAVRSVIPDSIERFIPGLAHGGIVGAAGGGPRSRWTMVGEQGRELVKLPFGSTVIPNGQTESMLAGGGSGGGKLEVEWVGGNAGDEFLNWLKKNIRIKAGSGPNSVQKALGV